MAGLKEMREGVKPEGIIIYWHTARAFEKFTYEHQEGKWKNVEAQRRENT